MKTLISLISTLAAGLLLSTRIPAEDYALDWFTTSSGGGPSTGGAYTLTGTIGQPEAGLLRGGAFTLEGGFWSGLLVVPTVEGPTLFIQRFAAGVIISWSPITPGFALETTDDLNSLAWEPGPGGNPVTIPAAGTAGFYRLRKL
jgi:hypothetical protein